MKKILISIVVVIVIVIFGLPTYKNKDLIPFDNAARAKAPFKLVKLEDGYTHYRQMGPRGGQTVILIHGFGTPLFSWDGVISGLADAGMNVIAYDIYGRGWSDRPNQTHNAVLFNRQLEQLIEALDLEEPVDLVGVSMGALVSGVYTQNNPEKVRRIGFISPGGYEAKFPFIVQMMRTPVIGGWLMDVFGDNALSKNPDDFAFENNPVPDIAYRYDEMLKYEGFKSALSSTLINYDLEKATNSYKIIGVESIPTQIIWGTADETTPYLHAKLLKQDIPQMNLHTIEDGTHALPLSHPQEITEILIDFLD